MGSSGDMDIRFNGSAVIIAHRTSLDEGKGEGKGDEGWFSG